jgi:hypothetical protein
MMPGTMMRTIPLGREKGKTEIPAGGIAAGTPVWAGRETFGGLEPLRR